MRSGWALVAGVAFGGIIGCEAEPASPPETVAMRISLDDALPVSRRTQRPAPHGGRLISLDEDRVSAEFVHDEPRQRITVYLLEGESGQAVPIEGDELTLNVIVNQRPMQFLLPAVPTETDPAGLSSRFELVDPHLSHLLHESPDLRGRLHVSIGGRSFVGNFEATDPAPIREAERTGDIERR